MKNRKINAFIIAIITIIILYFLVKDNYKEIYNTIINANISWILLAFLFYIIYQLFQAIPFYLYAKLYDKNISFSFFIYLMVVTNFFNGITPLATGGQPLQVYALHKKGIPTVNSTNIVLQHTIIYEIAVVLWLLFAVIINYVFNLFSLTTPLKILVVTGVTLNIIYLIGLLLASFTKSFNKNIITFIISILSKLRIVKDKSKTIEKWNKSCSDLYESSKVLLKNKGLFILCILLLIIGYTFNYSITYLIIKALNINTVLTYPISLILTCYIYTSSTYLPIPGATGGMEYSFFGYLKNFIAGYYLNVALILWRFITYYLPTMIGAIVFNIYTIKNDKK